MLARTVDTEHEAAARASPHGSVNASTLQFRGPFMETPSTASVQEGFLTMRVLTDGGVDDADLDRRIDHRLYPGIVVFGGIARIEKSQMPSPLAHRVDSITEIAVGDPSSRRRQQSSGRRRLVRSRHRRRHAWSSAVEEDLILDGSACPYHSKGCPHGDLIRREHRDPQAPLERRQ